MGILFALLTAWVSQAHATLVDLNDCSQYIGSCDYYLCKEGKQSCGTDGYYLSFGYKYCSLFDLQASSYSSRGQEWLGQVKTCLQEELEKTRPTNCGEAQSLALESHVKCYEQTDYCSLSFLDKALVYDTVGEELERRDFSKIAFRILKGCFTFE